MADEAQTTESTAEGKSRGKVIMLVAAMMVLEAALIIGVLMFVGGPSDVQAQGPLENLEQTEDEKIIELQVLDAKLFNSRTGVPYLYATEIYVHVQQKYAERVSDELDRFHNEMKTEIAAIWKVAEPHHFREPKNESLTRKVCALLDERFGIDAESGEPIVQKCIVYMGTGLRVDN